MTETFRPFPFYPRINDSQGLFAQSGWERRSLTAVPFIPVVYNFGFLSGSSKQFSPVDGVGVAQMPVPGDDHVSVADLLQGAQTQGRQVQANHSQRKLATAWEEN